MVKCEVAAILAVTVLSGCSEHLLLTGSRTVIFHMWKKERIK